MTTTPQGEAVLLPCPFCGSDDVAVQTYFASWVSCHDCKGEGGSEETPANAVAVWNTRAALAPPNAAIPSAEPIISTREHIRPRFEEWNHAWTGQADGIHDRSEGYVAGYRRALIDVGGDSGVREALDELIACKDLKDRAQTILDAEPCNIAYNTRYTEWVALLNDYRKRQPLAWAAARAAIEREEREKKA